MPRRAILSAAERENLLATPDDPKELICHYTLSESDLSIIRQCRGAANRLGFAVQLCYMRYPGVILGADDQPFAPLVSLVATQLKISPGSRVNSMPCWSCERTARSVSSSGCVSHRERPTQSTCSNTLTGLSRVNPGIFPLSFSQNRT
jgi:hypothetical protein